MDYSVFRIGQVFTRRHHSSEKPFFDQVFIIERILNRNLYISQIDHQANSLTLRSFVCNPVEFWNIVEKLELEEYSGFFA